MAATPAEMQNYLDALDAAGIVDNYGQTARAAMEHDFEIEDCEECGKGPEGHTPILFLGNWFYRCDSEEDE